MKRNMVIACPFCGGVWNMHLPGAVPTALCRFRVVRWIVNLIQYIFSK